MLAFIKRIPFAGNVHQLRALSTAKQSLSNKLVLIDVDEKTGHALMSLNRAPANSFNLDLLNAFNSALDEVSRNKSKGLILTSVRFFTF